MFDVKLVEYLENGEINEDTLKLYKITYKNSEKGFDIGVIYEENDHSFIVDVFAPRWARIYKEDILIIEEVDANDYL